MIELAGSAEKSIFTVDFKGQVSIGQAWVRVWNKSRPDARFVNSQQTRRKATCLHQRRLEEPICAISSKRYPAAET